MSLADRLRKSRKALGVSQRNLARMAGIPLATISALECGDRTYCKHLGKIAFTLNTTTDYLLEGVINLPSSVTSTKGNDKSQVELLDMPHMVPMVPVIDWHEAITWQGLEQNQPRKKYEMVPLFGKSGPRSFALKVKNDSMVSIYPNTDTFRQGDIIIIDPDKKPQAGCFVLAGIDGHPECVFRQYGDISGVNHLIPLNPNFPKEKVDNRVTILGVLTGTFRPQEL